MGRFRTLGIGSGRFGPSETPIGVRTETRQTVDGENKSALAREFGDKPENDIQPTSCVEWGSRCLRAECSGRTPRPSEYDATYNRAIRTGGNYEYHAERYGSRWITPTPSSPTQTDGVRTSMRMPDRCSTWTPLLTYRKVPATSLSKSSRSS